MRFESSVTSISWIPSEAIEGLPKLPFELGIVRYDDPPPDRLEEGDLERLCEAGAFREANHLAAWIAVEDGKVVDHGQLGEAFVGSTKFGLGRTEIVVPRVAFETLRPIPKPRGDAVRFVQTAGGRAGFPAPRTVEGKPYFRVHSATAWTTLSLTLGADGSSYHSLVGASPFPRHWIYDRHGELVEKSGTIDFGGWWREAHGARTPWGDEDSEAFVTAVETAFERELSRDLMTSGAVPERRTLEPDETLVQQGEPGSALFLLLDGVLAAEVDGKEVAEIGPGAIVGERAAFAGGTRTATLYARTRCRVAVIPSEVIDPQELEDLAEARRDA
jgi:Cyclic nucleotide-binding domain